MAKNELPRQQLTIPEPAVRDRNAVEMLRVWIAEQGLHCSIKIGMYQETGMAEEKAWGIILADAARHIANALSEGREAAAESSLRKIRDSMADELADPTSDVRGDFVSKH